MSTARADSQPTPAGACSILNLWCWAYRHGSMFMGWTNGHGDNGMRKAQDEQSGCEFASVQTTFSVCPTAYCLTSSSSRHEALVRASRHGLSQPLYNTPIPLNLHFKGSSWGAQVCLHVCVCKYTCVCWWEHTYTCVHMCVHACADRGQRSTLGGDWSGAGDWSRLPS